MKTLVEGEIELRDELMSLLRGKGLVLADYELGWGSLMWQNMPSGLFWPLPQSLHLDTALIPGGLEIYAIIIVLYGVLRVRIIPRGHILLVRNFGLTVQSAGEDEDARVAAIKTSSELFLPGK